MPKGELLDVLASLADEIELQIQARIINPSEPGYSHLRQIVASARQLNGGRPSFDHRHREE